MMQDILEDTRAKQVIRKILFNLSLIGFGLVVGVSVFREIREILILNRLGVNYCDLTPASQNSFHAVEYMFSFVIMYVLIIKFIIVICYSVLGGEKKRIIYYENALSFIIGMMSIIWNGMFPACLVLL
jgi:hypothetical protein